MSVFQYIRHEKKKYLKVLKTFIVILRLYNTYGNIKSGILFQKTQCHGHPHEGPGTSGTHRHR